MANEITVNFQLLFAMSGRNFTEQFNQIQMDAGSELMAQGTPSIGTGHEALPMQDVTAAGAAVFYNNDATNYVEVGVDNAGSFIGFVRIPPREFAFLPALSTNAPYARANTAAVKLSYMIIQR